MATEWYEIEIRAPAEKVFAHMDDIKNVGWHMSEERAMPMMGSSLQLEVIDGRQGVGATYRWKGRVMGMAIDIKEATTSWIKDREKTWQTMEKPKMIVMSGYAMHFALTPTERGTRVMFEIDYSLPKTPWGWMIGRLLARKYARWCLERACLDAKKVLEQTMQGVA